MHKTRIVKSIYERCLLTEVVPFETPLLFSNWGSYNYFHSIAKRSNRLLSVLFNGNKIYIPYTYIINKDLIEYRTLNIPHPGISSKILELYKSFDVYIVKMCSKSSFTIRAPHSVAKWFLLDKGKKKNDKYVEQINENNAYASSYFVYKDYSHLYRFFESKLFSSLEHKFATLVRLDISKCFPSIYTHSISWAVRGKKETKKYLFSRRQDGESFPRLFDSIMQAANHQETNGIIIGPELSRIFAEIILQEIDSQIEETLISDHTLINGIDYYCCRYIDDYYIFYNNEAIFKRIELQLKIELEKFKLYLNVNKSEVTHRPFITDASLLKIEISKYISELSMRIKDKQKITIEKELNKIRAIIGLQKDSLYKVTSFFLGSLISSYRNSLRGINDEQYLVNICVFIFQLSMYWFKMDTRVAASYKIVLLINDILKKTCKLQSAIIANLKSTLFYELSDAIEIAYNRKSIIESLNLIIAFKQLGVGYEIRKEKLDTLVSRSMSKQNDDDEVKDRNTYFDIVTFLYYIGNDTLYFETKQKLLDQSIDIIKKNDIGKYAESMMLYLDLISCPFIDKSYKKDITILVAKSLNISTREADINSYINVIAADSWYFNWAKSQDINALLKKKELMLSY